MNQKEAQYSEPESFIAYKKKNKILDAAMTAAVISVDFLDKLDPDLREAGLMVFRLGSPEGSRNTNFALAKSLTGWGDYFLIEDQLYNEIKPVEVELDNSRDEFTAFKLLPKLTETSLVNLSFASGILKNALEIDDINQTIPATCQSTFTFNVKPNNQCSVEWSHNMGQVEIDALFFGIRNNRKELYIVESKFGNTHTTLAKHKLVYPILSLRKKLPKDVSIVPVYLKTTIGKDKEIYFKFTECEFPAESISISQLIPKKSKIFKVKNF